MYIAALWFAVFTVFIVFIVFIVCTVGIPLIFIPDMLAGITAIVGILPICPCIPMLDGVLWGKFTTVCVNCIFPSEFEACN